MVTSGEKLPVESSSHIETVYTNDAKITIRITAPRLDVYVGDDPYTEFKKGLKLIFYDEQEEPKTQIECNYAINYEDTELLEAKDNVIVINKEGEELNTEHLIWDKSKHLIHTEEFVKIVTADEIIYGHGLESNEDFSEYKIMKVKGTIQLEEDEELQ